MKDLMTITLSDQKPSISDNGQFTPGDQATIFTEEGNGTFGYRFQGVNYQGKHYEGRYYTGFKSKQAALSGAVENYSKGLKC